MYNNTKQIKIYKLIQSKIFQVLKIFRCVKFRRKYQLAIPETISQVKGFQISYL